MQASDPKVVRQLPTLLASWLPTVLAGWLAASVAGCAVLPVAVYRPLPSTRVALDGMQEAQRSLADTWAYAETNFEAAEQSDSRVAAHGATHGAYQRWVNDEVRELPDPSETIGIGIGGDS